MFTSKGPVGNYTAKRSSKMANSQFNNLDLRKKAGGKKKQPDYKNQETQKSLVSVKSERAWPDCLLFIEVELGSQVRVLYLGGKQVESPEIV